MKREAVPANLRMYRTMFSDNKVTPAVWTSPTHKFLIGYDRDKKSRLIDLKRIGKRLLAELKETIPVEGEPLGSEIQETPKTPSNIAVTRVSQRNRQVTTTAGRRRKSGEIR